MKRRSSKQVASGVTFTDEPRNRLSSNSRPIGRDPTAPTLPIKPFERSRLGTDIGEAVSEAQRDLRQERPNTSRALNLAAMIANRGVSGTIKSGNRKGKK